MKRKKNQINKQILKTLTLLVWHNLNVEIFVILLEDYLFMEEQLNFFFAFPSMLSLPSKGDVVRVPVVQPLALLHKSPHQNFTTSKIMSYFKLN